ncbi:persulfide dioxygenase ETHE1 homolog, mitochondrial [Tanacetum coccineum]
MRVKRCVADVLLFMYVGDKIQFGDRYLEVRATPRNIVGCVTYITGDDPDQPEPRMTFTGDVVLIHGCGRTDFRVEVRNSYMNLSIYRQEFIDQQVNDERITHFVLNIFFNDAQYSCCDMLAPWERR